MADPIIIIGAGRSGTKFLRDVLAAGRGAAAVPYDVNYVWRYGADGAADDALPADGLTPARRDFIRRTLRRLAGIGRGDLATVLIEKTVSNCLRVPLVGAVEPRARFVHLIRDGRDVTESAMRQWQAPPDWRALLVKLRGLPLANLRYVGWFAGNFLRGLARGRGGGAVWGPRYPGIAEDLARLPLAGVCARQWAACVEAARRDLAALPASRVHEIRYEDLVRDEAAVAALAAALGLPDPAAVAAAWRARVRREPGGRWRALPADDWAAMMAGLGATLAALGYGDTVAPEEGARETGGEAA